MRPTPPFTVKAIDVNPGFGFGVNVVFIYIILASPALAMSILQPLLSSLSATLAEATGWSFLSDFSTWLLGNWGFAMIGTVWLLGCVVANWFGLKAAIRVLGAFWIIGLGGALLLTIALLLSKQSTFVTNLQALVGMSPDQIER